MLQLFQTINACKQRSIIWQLLAATKSKCMHTTYVYKQTHGYTLLHIGTTCACIFIVQKKEERKMQHKIMKTLKPRTYVKFHTIDYSHEKKTYDSKVIKVKRMFYTLLGLRPFFWFAHYKKKKSEPSIMKFVRSGVYQNQDWLSATSTGRFWQFFCRGEI